MNGLSLKNISKIAFILAAFVSVGFLCISKPTAFFGVWVGSLWMFLNIFFLFHLLNIALNFNFKKKNQIFLPLIFKFPMLYVAGFFILRSRLFPVYSLLLGLTLFMLALMIQWLRTRSQGKSLASLLFLMAWPVLAHAEESSFDSLNFVRLTTEILGHTPFSEFLHRFENVIFGVIIISLLTAVFYFMSRAAKLIPGRLQSAGELLVEGGHVLVAPFPSQLASQPWVLMMVFVRSDSSIGASASSDRLQISSRRIRSASSWSPSAFMTCARHRRVLSPSGSARLAT